MIRFAAAVISFAFAFLRRITVLGINFGRYSITSNLRSVFESKSGILAPGDSPLSNGRAVDYHDYRGTARVDEIQPLLQGAGVSLGYFLHPRKGRGSPIALPIDLLQRNCAVIGPPGSGKTEGIVVPWILEILGQKASVVTCDIKGDLFDRLAPDVQRMGCRLWYWNSADPVRSQSWNWMDGLQDDRDIEAATQSILGRRRPNDTQPFFFERDYRWLRALTSMTKAAYRHTAVPRYLYSLLGDQSALRNLLKQCPHIRPQAAEIADLLQFSVDEHSRAVSGLLNALYLFNTAPVVRVTEHSDFSLSDIDRLPTLLIVGASLADALTAEVMSSMMLNQLFNHVYRRFSRSVTGVSTPLYFVIDESPRLKDRINYEEVLSVARSAKVGVCLAAQDVSQFGDQRQQAAILTNCSTFITLRGASPHTAKYMSSRLGQRSEQVVTTTRNRNPFDLFSNRGQTTQNVTLPVLGEREIMYPPTSSYCGVAQVSPVSRKPFLIDLTRP